jgi:PAS domain S-box-containing protein
MQNINMAIISAVREQFTSSDIPLLNQTRLRYLQQPFLQGKKVVYNAHLTLSSILQIEVLLAAGADVLVTLSDELMIDDEAVGIIKRANIPVEATKSLKNYACYAALDCCGELADKIIPEVGVAELTKTGIEVYRQINANYAVISVDDADIKKLETNIGTADGFVRAFRLLTKQGLSHKKIVIFGYGKVGTGIAKALQELNADVVIIDKIQERVHQARNLGISAYLMEEAKSNLENVFAVITATGIANAISGSGFTDKDFGKAYLANMGSEDEWGENFTNHEVMFNRKPINFYLKEPTRIVFLDPVFCAQILALEDLHINPERPGIHRFSRQQDLDLLLQWTLIHHRPAIKGDYLENLIANIPAFIYWKDQSLVYQGCNAPFAAVAGLNNPQDVIGKTDFDLAWGGSEANIYRQDDERVLSGTKMLDFEETQLIKDGKLMHVLASKVPYSDHEGNIIGILGVYFDITERKQREVELAEAKERAEAANKLKSEFLAITSHELRTPMTAMLGLIDLLKSKSNDKKTDENYLSLLEDQGQSLLTIINNILNFSKLEAEKYIPNEDTINLEQLFNTIIPIFQFQAEHKNLTFTSTIQPAMPMVCADNSMLRQIIINLLSNAFKFTEQGSIEMKVKGKVIDDIFKLHIMVCDTGIGMSKDEQTIIFEKFQQGKPRKNQAQMGTGLGLAIVDKFVKMLQGKIILQSEPNRGSCFEISLLLPLAAQQHLVSPSQNNTTTQQEICSRKQVLLVEDDSVVALVHKSMLENLGHQVYIANNAANALKLANTHPIDLALVDLGLPDTSGAELIRILKNESQVTFPIIVLTAFIDNNNCQQAIDAGAQLVLSKPVNTEQLTRLLANC